MRVGVPGTDAASPTHYLASHNWTGVESFFPWHGNFEGRKSNLNLVLHMSVEQNAAEKVKRNANATANATDRQGC